MESTKISNRDLNYWVTISQYPNYEVSRLGKIRNRRTGKVLKPILDKDHYCQVNLFFNKKSKTEKVHRTVAKTFIPNPLNYCCINHKDGNKKNNTINNLEWVTKSQNTKHAYDNNLLPSGEEHHFSKLTNKEKLKIIHLRKNGWKIKELSEHFLVSQGRVSQITSL